MNLRGFGRRVGAETLLATAGSATALALLASARGLGPLQPLNATSHWLNGDGVARRRGWGWRTTGVGLATHTAATAFWAALFELWRRSDEDDSPSGLAGKVAAMAGVSAVVDYTLTPKRFTPGWEFVLGPRAMAIAYFAMAAGFAAGALWDGDGGGRRS